MLLQRILKVLAGSNKRTFTGEKHFPCDQCTNKFSANNDLKNQRITQTREKQISQFKQRKQFSKLYLKKPDW